MHCLTGRPSHWLGRKPAITLAEPRARVQTSLLHPPVAAHLLMQVREAVSQPCRRLGRRPPLSLAGALRGPGVRMAALTCQNRGGEAAKRPPSPLEPSPPEYNDRKHSSAHPPTCWRRMRLSGTPSPTCRVSSLANCSLWQMRRELTNLSTRQPSGLGADGRRRSGGEGGSPCPAAVPLGPRPGSGAKEKLPPERCRA